MRFNQFPDYLKQHHYPTNKRIKLYDTAWPFCKYIVVVSNLILYSYISLGSWLCLVLVAYQLWLEYMSCLEFPSISFLVSQTYISIKALVPNDTLVIASQCLLNQWFFSQNVLICLKWQWSEEPWNVFFFCWWLVR